MSVVDLAPVVASVTARGPSTTAPLHRLATLTGQLIAAEDAERLWWELLVGLGEFIPFDYAAVVFETTDGDQVITYATHGKAGVEVEDQLRRRLRLERSAPYKNNDAILPASATESGPPPRPTRRNFCFASTTCRCGASLGCFGWGRTTRISWDRRTSS